MPISVARSAKLSFDRKKGKEPLIGVELIDLEFKNVFLSFYVFFLIHGNCYSYQILCATSNSCKLSFHVVTKKLIDGKPLKSWQEKIQR